MFAPMKFLRRFARAKDGATAIEFGLIAAPFFMIVFGMAEVAMVGLAQTNLDYAVSETGREIRTGRAQLAGVSATDIQASVCESFGRFMAVDCDSNLHIDIRQYEAFTDIQTAPPIVNGELQTAGFQYEPGAPSDIVVVRAYYRWHVMTPLFDRLLANANGGERLIISTMMFRNEPYEAEPTS